MLNAYFTVMVEVIQSHHGTVSVLMGDGLMAIFGAPLDDPHAAVHAVEAAKAMVDSLPKVNAQLVDRGANPIDIGIGIHYGRVVVGNIGSPRKMEYTAIGDAVNLASRVETLTRSVDAKILITGELFNAAENRIDAQFVGDFDVKGRMNKVAIYRVA